MNSKDHFVPEAIETVDWNTSIPIRPIAMAGKTPMV
jgi:hypothetical protein